MQQTATRTAGTQNTNRFDLLLEALAVWLDEIPGCSYTGTPQEIVEQVLGSTDMFCREDVDEQVLVGNLARGLAICVISKGGKYDLGAVKHNPIDGKPQIEVYLLNT